MTYLVSAHADNGIFFSKKVRIRAKKFAEGQKEVRLIGCPSAGDGYPSTGDGCPSAGDGYEFHFPVDIADEKGYILLVALITALLPLTGYGNF